MKSHLIVAAALAVVAPSATLFAQAPAPATPRPAPAAGARASQSLPPPGIAIPDADRAELTAGAAELKREIDALASSLKAKPELLALLPDVEIFHKAIDWPLRYNEFYNVKEIPNAKKVLALGKERAAQLAKGEHPWTTQIGPVVRGYRSTMDGSIQPYGVVVPANWKPEEKAARKALVWLLGRGNTRTELAFINERLGKAPEITCADGFVLVPYGRFCNATKFAGEVDVFEALKQIQKNYAPIDEQRIAVAGFSMGGASAWHLGAHFAGMWSFVSPGAGFAETREYNKVFAPGRTPPPAWEQTLWRWYDATDYAGNLGNVPTLAYSGEIDKQIQSAEIMKRFAEKEGVTIEHFIGPKTEHKYEPETRKKLQARMDEILQTPRPAQPKKFRWVTYSLVYPGPSWLRVTGMEKQWERAEVNFATAGSGADITTKNVTGLMWTPEGSAKTAALKVDGQSVEVTRTDTASGTPGPIQLSKVDGKWIDTNKAKLPDLVKWGQMSGPIDHAFMSSFLHVRPTGAAQNAKVGDWAKSELEHARGYWRQIFRGEAPVKDDTALTDADIRNNNLVLWGDPASNAVLKRIIGKLPLEWTKEKLVFGGQTYDATKTAPILIFRNPLNPARYVVINSGVTMRESSMGTNSQQTPKLPDWAIVDLDTPPGPDWPGKILQAGFFDEQWKYTATQPSVPK